MVTSVQVALGKSGGREAALVVGQVAHISRVVAFEASGQKKKSTAARLMVQASALHVAQSGRAGEVIPGGGGVIWLALLHAVLDEEYSLQRLEQSPVSTLQVGEGDGYGSPLVMVEVTAPTWAEDPVVMVVMPSA